MEKGKRLIDANALEFEPDENCIANGVLIWGGRSGAKTMTTALSALKKMIDNAPTVDAVEVVRCKKCRHFTGGMAIGMCKRIAGKEIMPIRYDDFCSYGERRENDVPSST